MSQAESIGIQRAVRADSPNAANVRAAIARAANATGVDFNYLLAQAKIESGLDPNARAKTSSASGLFQFTNGTWLSMLERHGAEHGIGWAEAAIDRGRITDPGLRAQIMALRSDPDISARMAAEFYNDNRTALRAVLGREPDAGEHYLAAFLGAGGAAKILNALQANPDQSAAALLPEAAAANRSIFYAGGAPRSVAEVVALMRGKISVAMGNIATDAGSVAIRNDSPPAQMAAGEPLGLRYGAASVAGADRGPFVASMAETLRSTFALDRAESEPAAPRIVRAAYSKLQAFGL